MCLSAYPKRRSEIKQSPAAHSVRVSAKFFGAMLTAGQTLSHFKILGEISRGGMGIVYRAFDTRLERVIALKVLPPALVADPDRKRRFVQEARAAAALSHPYIAVVHAIDEEDGVTFIAMELIEGRLLSEALRHEPLPIGRALTLAIEVAEGLTRAHEKGIVHRDLKPGNVMVTNEGHSKIIDFGLAKLVEVSEASSTGRAETTLADHTRPGVVMGTTAYMSPEQARGEAVDFRTDVWSFGVMLFEMITGNVPFQGRTGTDVVSAILRDPTPRFPTASSEVPRVTFESLQRVVDRCLEKNPRDRYQSMRDVVLDLRAIERHSDPAIATHAARRRLSPALVLSSIAIVGLMALGGWLLTRPTPVTNAPSVAPPPATVRRSVAVLGFQNLSGRPEVDWLSTALSELFSSELAAGETLRMIPGETVARGRIELALASGESFSRETLSRIRTNLGCDLVLVGSYLSMGEAAGRKLRLDLRLQDAMMGETVASISDLGNESDLLELVSRTGARLRERLGVAGLSPDTAATVRASVPANQEATRLYAEGLSRLRQFEALQARDLLQQAAAADPKHPLIRAALSEAWSGLGYDATARHEAQAAFDQSKELSRENKLVVEARYRLVNREWDRAIQIYETLVEFFPDNLEYGLALAGAQTSGAKAQAALETVERLRRLPTPPSLDPRIDLAEASAASALSDYKRAEAAAARAATKGAGHGAPLLVARAKLQQGGVLDRMGDRKAAIVAAQEARQLFAAAGDKAGVARVQFLEAGILRGQGNVSAAKELAEQILATGRETGDQRVMANVLSQLGIIQLQQGDIAGSIDRLRQSLAVYRKLGDNNALARALNNLAGSLQLSGQLDEAATMYEESLALARGAGDRNGIGFALNNLAEVRETKAEIQEARRLYEEALTIRRELGYKEGIGYTATRLGGLLIAQDDLAGARSKLDEALKIRTELDASADVAETRLFLGTLAIEEARPSDAEQLARQALEAFEKERMNDRAAAGYELLARALLAQSKPGDARAAIDRGRALTAGTQDRYVQFAVRLTAARVQDAEGRTKEARSALQALLNEARTAGFSEFGLQVQYVLGEVEARLGLGRERLQSLQKDASARGYVLLARKSSATRS